jgi:hypothetical protein
MNCAVTNMKPISKAQDEEGDKSRKSNRACLEAGWRRIVRACIFAASTRQLLSEELTLVWETYAN